MPRPAAPPPGRAGAKTALALPPAQSRGWLQPRSLAPTTFDEPPPPPGLGLSLTGRSSTSLGAARGRRGARARRRPASPARRLSPIRPSRRRRVHPPVSGRLSRPASLPSRFAAPALTRHRRREEAAAEAAEAARPSGAPCPPRRRPPCKGGGGASALADGAARRARRRAVVLAARRCAGAAGARGGARALGGSAPLRAWVAAMKEGQRRGEWAEKIAHEWELALRERRRRPPWTMRRGGFPHLHAARPPPPAAEGRPRRRRRRAVAAAHRRRRRAAVAAAGEREPPRAKLGRRVEGPWSCEAPTAVVFEHSLRARLSCRAIPPRARPLLSRNAASLQQRTGDRRRGSLDRALDGGEQFLSWAVRHSGHTLLEHLGRGI